MLFRNGEPTPLSVLLQGGDMKGVAQSKDGLPKTESGSGGAGNGGRRSGSAIHSIVRVEPTDDLTICITPSAGTRLSVRRGMLCALCCPNTRWTSRCACHLNLGIRLRRCTRSLLSGEPAASAARFLGVTLNAHWLRRASGHWLAISFAEVSRRVVPSD